MVETAFARMLFCVTPPTTYTCSVFCLDGRAFCKMLAKPKCQIV